MINLNNSILITSDSDNKFIIPYTPLSFFSIDDKNTTREIESYYEKQLLYSKKYLVMLEWKENYSSLFYTEK
ncbi:hypothetical protein [Tenacibaculum maritimum]|uniref:hypothetical protein n=1 Tax=Tenacibaculum maritimum TaxID=107401 RepID=UPI00388D11B4